MWRRTSAPPSKTSSLRPALGIALFVLWAFVLSAAALGDVHCYDAATGQQGIDAPEDGAWYEPFGLPLRIQDEVMLAASVVMLGCIAAVWWPYRPWRKRS